MRTSKTIAYVIVLMLVASWSAASTEVYLTDDFTSGLSENWIHVRGTAEIVNGQLKLTADDGNSLDAKVMTWDPYAFAQGTLFQAEVTGFEATTLRNGFDVLAQMWVTPTPDDQAYFHVPVPSLAVTYHYDQGNENVLIVLWKKGWRARQRNTGLGGKDPAQVPAAYEPLVE